MTERTEKPVRILVALDASRRVDRLLDVAAALAAHRKAELAALLIEDVNLFHLAELPFATEVDSVCGIERKVDPLEMSHIIQLRVAQVRQMLMQLGRSRRLQVSLTVVRGHYMREAISAAAEVEVLFLGRERFLGRIATKRGSAPKKAAPMPEELPVWVLFDGSENSVRALRLADDLAHDEHRRLKVALQSGAASDAGKLRQMVSAMLSGVRFDSPWVADTADGIGDFLEMVGREGAGVVVMPRKAEGEADAVTRILLEHLSCPLVLVA